MTDALSAEPRPALRWLLVVLLAALALVALERMFALTALRQAAPVSAPPPMSGVPSSYKEALARLDRGIEDARDRAESRDSEWLMHEILARRHLARARLTGSFDDYAAAEAALTRAFEVARPRTGPHLSLAVLEFAVHRLGAADRALDAIDGYAVAPDRGERAAIAAMRGDIAFYRGDYAAALAAYDEADRIAPGTADFSRAVYHSRTGDADLADDYFHRAGAAATARAPQQAANIALQRGVLDLERGRWDEALAHFTEADGIFPGHWLIEEHVAEVTALKGDVAGAERLYRDIIRRTGHPEFMDAMAGLARQRGDTAGAEGWTRRAAEAWSVRLRQFPEAAYGHALDHCLAAGKRACALDLARRNHASRPYGEAKVLLARALLDSGRAEEAGTLIDAVLASPWRTADTHAVAAAVYRALGRSGEAAAQARAARALDPRSVLSGP